MKRNLFLIITAFVGLFVFAQSQMNFHLLDAIESISISSVDTIRFTNGTITVEGPNKKYSVPQVEKVTFSLDASESLSDTVFVTYQGNSATVVNPFSAIAEQVDGAHVSLISSAATKGIVYYLSGTSTDGSFSLTPDKSYTLVFDNLNLTSAGTSAPILLNESLDGSSYVVNVHLRGNSSVADASSNSSKGAILTKSKLKISTDSVATLTGALSVKGNKKHAINSSKRVELYSGSLIIDGAAGDGINADGLEMYDGSLTISNTTGDGVDCSEVIVVENGTIKASLSAEDAKALKCDSIVRIAGGTITLDVDGAGSKGIKAGQKAVVTGGTITATLNATTAFYDSDADDFGFNAAITSNGIIELSDNANITVKGAGVAAKALNCDSVITINGGLLTVNMTGADYSGTYSDGYKDTFAVFAVKADRYANVNGGTLNLTLGSDCKVSKGLKADYVNIAGGNLTINNTGGYYYNKTTSSSSSSQGGRPGGGGPGSSSQREDVENTVPKGILADERLTITGGTIDVTVAFGKGLKCDKTIVLGTEKGSDSDYSLTVNTGSSSDATYKASSEKSKTLPCSGPKAIQASDTLIVNSGTIDVVTLDCALKGKYAFVNGGKLTLDAKNDQGIHGIQELTVNGGDILVTNSFEGFEGVTITMNGGVTAVYSWDDGWNASTSTSGSGSPMVIVNGGYHYVHVGSGDTDCIDSNGGMKFTGGVVIVEGGSTLDGGDQGSPTFTYEGGKLLLFGSGIENSPIVCYKTTASNVSKGTRYTMVENGTVLASFAPYYDANTGGMGGSGKSLFFLYKSAVSMVSGGTVNPTTTVTFRWLDNSTMQYYEGGSVNNGSNVSVSSAQVTTSSSNSGFGGGGWGF